MVKVLWPDGPRWVSDEKIIGWAIDGLCDERGLTVEDAKACVEDDIETAIEIVNRLGLATTER